MDGYQAIHFAGFAGEALTMDRPHPDLGTLDALAASEGLVVEDGKGVLSVVIRQVDSAGDLQYLPYVGGELVGSNERPFVGDDSAPLGYSQGWSTYDSGQRSDLYFLNADPGPAELFLDPPTEVDCTILGSTDVLTDRVMMTAYANETTTISVICTSNS